MRFRLVIILICIVYSARGQDLPDLTNYQHNWLIFNPAFTGSRDVRSISMFSRDNAILNPGTPAPKYFQLSMHTPFKNAPKNAWGISYYNEKKPGLGYLGLNFQDPAPTTEHNLTGYYAHKVKIGSGVLSLGLSGVISNVRVDNSAIVARQNPDPLFLVDIEPVWKANFGAGMLFYQRDFFVALSVPRLLPPITLFDRNPSVQKYDTAGLGINSVNIGPGYLNYNYMLTAGKQIEINDELTIYPSFLTGYIPAAGFLNINYMLSLNIGLLNERVWVGAIYKSANEISVNLNLELFDSEILMGFSWDIPLSKTAGYFENAFEIVLRWDNLTKVLTKAPFYF